MNKKIKVGIVGCGNCCSSLIQGLFYYKNKTEKNAETEADAGYWNGLMHWDVGGYLVSDIEVVAAFDVDKRKVGKDISEAIFQPPNCTKKFCDVPFMNVKVMKGPVIDGVAPHMKEYFQVDDNQKHVDIVDVLIESRAEVLINYLSVGSVDATRYYADKAILAGCGFVNRYKIK